MANPFSSFNIKLPKKKKSSPRLPKFDIQAVLQKNQASTPKEVRDRLILLLRCKYHLKPSEIAALNVNNVDIATGIIEIASHRKNPHIFLCEEDLIHFRRWIAVRRLYAASNPAFIISLHWTRGRSEPHQRISTRGIFQTVQKYGKQEK
jgi:site-specific recombinase XerC